MPKSGVLTWIAHVDLDAFFASVEQRDNPEYRGKPVVVGALPGGRGVVAACSYEARRFGIHSAMPVSRAARLCPGAVYLRPRMQVYRAVSREIMDLLDTVSPVVEKASVDEAYLDISGLERISGTPEDIGHSIRRLIHDATGLTASVGIGPNRLIAKLASEAAKPNGQRVVRPAEVTDFIGAMPIGQLRGMGEQTLRKLQHLGISTVAQLRTVAPDTLRACVGARAAESFLRQASGIGSTRVEPGRQRKSISKETTFSRDVTDTERLHDTLRDLSRQVAGTARREGLAGRVVTLKVRYRGFDTYTRRRTLAQATDDERVIESTGWSLFTQGDLPRDPVRLIGVGISDWAAGTQQQTDLFTVSGHGATDARVLETIDSLEKKYGKTLLRVGANRKPRA